MKQTMRAAQALVMVGGRALWRGWSATPFEALESRTLLSGVGVTTAPAAPQGLSAVLASPGMVTLNWEASIRAGGYQVLRSVDGGAMATIASIGSPDQLSFQTPVQGNRLYQYEVRAFNAAGVSASSTRAQVLTPMAAATNITATAGLSGVQVTWTDNEPANTSYLIMRSVNGGAHRLHAKVEGGAAAAYLDVSAVSGAVYSYRVVAMGAANVSQASASAAVAVQLRTPSVTALASETSVSLSWTGLDPATVTYTVSRATGEQGPFQTVAVLDRFARGYEDSGLTPGTGYVYRVVAGNAAVSSSAAVMGLETSMAGLLTGPNITQGMSVQTRYGSEAVITLTGVGESVSISQNGGLLTLMSGGVALGTLAAPQSLFVYDRAGSASITVASSVTVRTTIVGINNAPTSVTSAGQDVRVWIDSTDAFSGTGVVNRVSGYAGGVSKALGASLPNPGDSGPVQTLNASLFGAGPVMADVNQGGVGDCYFLASLAAFAEHSPGVLLNSAVDLGDGTYAVRYYEGSYPVYVRVSNEVPSGPYGGYGYAHPGELGSVWAPVMEKAFAYFREGENKYASIASGWMSEAYAALGVASVDFWMGTSESAFFGLMSTALDKGWAVTLATVVNPPSLVGGHAYTLVRVELVDGVGRYVVRNPWGVSGTAEEDANGYATLTFSDMTRNFVMGTRAA